MLYGDAPPEDKELVKELLEMESFFKSKEGVYPSEEIAMGYVCLSHDYYEIGLEEKGQELLEKAEIVCPGYFTNQIYSHMIQDPDFEFLVSSLKAIILLTAKSMIGE